MADVAFRAVSRTRHSSLDRAVALTSLIWRQCYVFHIYPDEVYVAYS